MQNPYFKLYQDVVDKRLNAQLTSNFTVKEMVRSSKKDINNWPTDVETVWYLHHLCWYVLQKVRNHYGKPVRVTSGYRCPQLNKRIGGSSTSQHMTGQAADFEIFGVDNREVAKWIHTNLNFDQLILEFYKSDSGINSGWIHCSYKPSGNRKQFLVAKKQNKKTLYLPATIQQLNNL